MDVLGNFTTPSADPATVNGTRWFAGTSAATPLVAGTVSRALGIVREQARAQGLAGAEAPLAAQDDRPWRSARAFRDALNATARLVGPKEFEPLGAPEGDPLRGRLSSPSEPILLQAQQGWGVVSPDMAPAIARAILEGAPAPSAEKASAAQAQAAWQGARETYWG
jgi:hypothetical protein